MHGFLAFDQEIIDRAIDQIKQRHLQHYGTLPESLVWAIAFETLAAQIRQNCTQHQIVKAGLDLELPTLAES
jgi:hypothetical protein